MNSCTNGKLLKWHAGDWMREILLSFDEIVELVGEHIYPVVAPENTEGNFYVYSRTEYSRDYAKFGIQNDKATLLLRAVSDDYDTSILMAELADAVLSGPHKSEEGISIEFKLVDSKEGFDDFKYYQDLFFAVD